MLSKRSEESVHGGEFAAETAIRALGFLAEGEERLERFLALSGLGPHNLRRAAADPAFLTAVLDYITADEKLLLEFAQAAQLAPTTIVRAQAQLAGPPHDAP